MVQPAKRWLLTIRITDQPQPSIKEDMTLQEGNYYSRIQLINLVEDAISKYEGLMCEVVTITDKP